MLNFKIVSTYTLTNGNMCVLKINFSPDLVAFDTMVCAMAPCEHCNCKSADF